VIFTDTQFISHLLVSVVVCLYTIRDLLLSHCSYH